MEKCRRCKREYLRDYGVVGLYNHFTGTSATPPRVIVIVCVCSCSAVNKCDDPSCRGKLLDTIINFGESLPEGKRCSTFWSTVNIFSHLFLPFPPPPPHTHTHTHAPPPLHTDTLQTSFDHAEKADLCVVMGSSLTVTPAANIPEVHQQL